MCKRKAQSLTDEKEISRRVDCSTINLQFSLQQFTLFISFTEVNNLSLLHK